MARQDTARAFWIQAPGRGTIVDGPLPELADGDVRVRTVRSGISRGTEALVFRGEVPPSQYATMRCPFQDGDFPAPVKYGYMSVGVVEAGRGDAAASLEGRTVFCLYPHQDRYVVPASSVTTLPDGLPPSRAVLAANMETALTGVWDAGVGPGDRVVVVGAGVVGLLTAWICNGIPGTDVTAVDPNPLRKPVAESLGVAFSEHVPTGADADVVIHASATEAGLRSALGAAGTEGTVIELSWYGTRPVSLPLGGAFHSRRLRIRSSQVGRIPPERAPRWDNRRRMGVALGLLGDSALDALLTGESPFASLPDVMARLSVDGRDTLCHSIVYGNP